MLIKNKKFWSVLPYIHKRKIVNRTYRLETELWKLFLVFSLVFVIAGFGIWFGSIKPQALENNTKLAIEVKSSIMVQNAFTQSLPLDNLIKRPTIDFSSNCFNEIQPLALDDALFQKNITYFDAISNQNNILYNQVQSATNPNLSRTIKSWIDQNNQTEQTLKIAYQEQKTVLSLQKQASILCNKSSLEQTKEVSYIQQTLTQNKDNLDSQWVLAYQHYLSSVEQKKANNTDFNAIFNYSTPHLAKIQNLRETQAAIIKSLDNLS